MQQPLLARVDLAAQVGHIGLDDVHVATEVVAPHMVEDLRLRQHGPCIDDEVAQQGEFGRRQGDGLAGLPYLVGVLVELDIGEREPGGARLLNASAGPPQDHAQPRDHLFETERLGDVVVAAEGQTCDLVLQGVAGGEEQGGRLDAVGAEPAQHSEAVHARHHDVEDDGVRTHFAGLVQSGGTAGGGVHFETLELQADRQKLDDVRLVVNHQHAGLGNALWYGHSHRTSCFSLQLEMCCPPAVHFL